MSASAARGASSASVRVFRVWRALPHERRLAAAAALALFVTLFLPWYQETVIANGVSSLRSASASLTGWGAFSFVEAAVLLVAVSVLALLFIRAEGGAFHVPGGDGGVITAAGVWTCALIVWRMFDKEGTSGHGEVATTSGIEWGIFVALGVAGLLTYAGSRIRLAHEPEPPLPGEPGRGPRATATRRPRQDELGVDDSWAHLSPRSGAGPGSGGGRDGFARDAGAPASPAPAAPAFPASPAPAFPDEEPTIRRSSDSGAVPRRGLDRREIAELDLADPPTAPLKRSAPPARPDLTTGDDDPVTVRYDRPR